MTHVLVIHGVWHEAIEPGAALDQWIRHAQAGIGALDHVPPPETAFVLGFYGDILPETDPLAGFLARHTLSHRHSDDRPSPPREPLPFLTGPRPTIGAIAQAIDQRTDIGDLISHHLFDSVARYLTFGAERDAIVARIVDQIRAMNDTIVIAAHSLGSIVAYDLLRSSPEAQQSVSGLITFGSPLWLSSAREQIKLHFGDTAFPEMLPRWINVYDPDDPVAGDINLASLFPAADGRMVEDHRLPLTNGLGFRPRDPHDPFAYAGSPAFARALHSLLAHADTPRGGSRNG